MNQSPVTEIINQQQIKAILKEFKGERQLRELKFYLLSFQSELKTIGIDGSTLAWQIYTTYKNLNR
jgi:hypothetical protein